VSEIACPSCGAATPSANRFCGTCGQVLEHVCPSCGTANPLANRFCGSCGAELHATAGASPDLEERKVVSMLFADLTASTEMASRLDPEDLRDVLSPFFDAMAQEIDRYGGTVEKYIGDAVVAAFGAPVAHEDDPERAIRCALAMQRRLAELNDELSERAGGDLAMRIGVNTGEVLAHAIEEGIVTGEAVNIAARFQALAEPGRIVVGERTYRDTRQAFAFGDLGEVSVKGIDRPLRVFDVQGVISRAHEQSPGLDAPFVGRVAEMELLRLLFARTVSEGRPNLVTVVGPPGIGKSRLSHEAARTLGGEGARVIRGRCLPYGDGLTYWPLAEILKADAGILESDSAETMLAKARERLDPRFPGEEGIGVTSMLLSSIGVELPTDPLAGAEREAAPGLIARAWRRYVESLAADAPLVVLIEDLHWADTILLELIESVVSRAGGPALVLCMARPDLFERRPGWGGGPSEATTISLSALSAGDGTELIEHMLGGQAPAEVVGPILQRSEGNPFFVGELIRMMIEDATIARREGRWALARDLPSALPDTVQGVIASRIDLLTPEEKRAIQDASVIGRIFWPGGVSRLGSPEAERAIEGLIAKGLVWEREVSTIADERELMFNHILTRDVAYGSIPRARRSQAHAIVGAWIEQGTAGRAEEYAEILAHHFFLAGDPARTARYALLAGQRLLRVFAAEDAITWLDRATEARGSAPSVVVEAALWLGVAKEQLGRYEEAKADYERARSQALGANDAELEARALAAIAHVLWLLDRFDEGKALLPEALERARAVGLADVEAGLLYTAGTMRFGRGEYREALPMHERALAVALGSGDVERQALAHHGLSETYFFLGPHAEGLAHGLQADRLFRDLGQRPMVAHNGYIVGALLASLGRPDEGLVAAEASLGTAIEMGSGREAAFACFIRSWINLSIGRLDAAMANGEDGLARCRELGLGRGEMIGLLSVNEMNSELQDLDRMGSLARASLEISDRIGGTFMRPQQLAYAGWAALPSGDGDGEAMLSAARTMSTGLLDRAWAGRVEVLACEWAGDPEALGSVASWIEEAVQSESAFWGMWGRYARALGAQLRDRHEEAIEAGTLVRDASIAFGERRLQWRAAGVLWRSLQALGRKDEAAGYRKEAVAVLDDVAANASGSLREPFLARPDVAELVG